ncbi:MAG: Gfo/Idh/MocA family oxidoreductase [Chloroflexota bacterium]|nr:Gfo/Idh/MocA family oxidoreductase [Chloroflexota bacterium]
MESLNIGLIGTGFMGRTHSNAYAQVNKFFDHRIRPVLKAVYSRNTQKASAFAARWGWESVEADWQLLIRRSDIDAVDICTPNSTHASIALAAATAGKVIVCEKPLAMNAEEARTMVEAAEQSGKPTMVSFNYRRIPAVALAKQLVDEGRLGRLFHYRARYLQDWTLNPQLPQGGDTLWRLAARDAGSGVTGDLLAHSIDLALWLAGPIAQVTAMTETFVKERPLWDDPDTMKPVEIDDACAFLARFVNGALGTFESTRYARGRKNQNTFEINGEHGSISFDLEDQHQLQYYDHADSALVRGFRTIPVWDTDHPYMKHWWVPGCAIGYEHTFIHQVSDFLYGMERGVKLVPDFRDGYETQRVCDAVLASACAGTWQQVN